jgi:hypothetical protein
VIWQRGTLQSTETVAVPQVTVEPSRRISSVDMAPVSSCTPSKRTVGPLTVVLPTLRPLTRARARADRRVGGDLHVVREAVAAVVVEVVGDAERRPRTSGG